MTVGRLGYSPSTGCIPYAPLSNVTYFAKCALSHLTAQPHLFLVTDPPFINASRSRSDNGQGTMAKDLTLSAMPQLAYLSLQSIAEGIDCNEIM